MLFRLGQQVRLTGDSDVVGDYDVTIVQTDMVTLQSRARRQTVLLRPRHAWLRDEHGKSLDVWTICNVIVDGEHLTNGIVTESDAGHLVVETGC